MSTKVLIADKLPDEKVEELKKLGCTVVYDKSLKEESLLQALQEEQPGIIVVRSTRVTGPMIEADPNLNLIIRAGAGVNTIDVTTASRRSVYVANCPGKNSVAVAELAFGLILSLDRRIPDNVSELRQGQWNKQEYSKADGIFGKTLGIIGVGRIGGELITRAKAFGLHVLAWSRSLTPARAEELGVEYAPHPEAVAAKADIISVHLALTGDTRGLIGDKFFQAMKAGAYFINTSRAEVVDEQALLRAVEEKGIRAGLDVLADEPAAKTGQISSKLAGKPGVYGTHHIGASTNQAQNAVAEEAIRIVRELLSTGKVANCVNLLARTPAKYVLSVHHRNTVGVLAGVLDVIRDQGINLEIMENFIFSGAEGACANIQLDDRLSEDALAQIQKSSGHIISVAQHKIT